MGKKTRQAKRAADTAGDAAETAIDSKSFEVAARAGYIATGLLHLLIGIIAFQVALGQSGEANQSGALKQLASTPGGIFLVWAGFLGSAALALFLIAQAIFDWKNLDTKKRLKKQIIAGSKALVFAAISVTFSVYAFGGTGNSDQTARSVSSVLMSSMAGSVLLVAIGVGVLIAGGYHLFSGVTKRFEVNLVRVPHGTAGKAVIWLGRVGYTAKGAALTILGLLIVVATVRQNPEQSSGLDGALKSLRDQPFGPWLLAAVGLGLICYGLFSAVRSKYQKM